MDIVSTITAITIDRDPDDRMSAFENATDFIFDDNTFN